MHIQFIKPGLLSTIQDLGRLHHLSDAVPVSGAMDTLACRIANLVLGNPENATVIEFTFHGAVFLAETDLLISYSGEGATLNLGDMPLARDRPLIIPAKSVLSFSKNSGSRTYLAVAGGWQAADVLGSKSTYIPACFGGMDGRSLKTGDLLQSNSELSPLTRNLLHSLQAGKTRQTKWSVARSLFIKPELNTIRIIPGREFTWFPAGAILSLLSASFTVGNRSDRMAFQLEGDFPICAKKREMPSAAVTQGTIQASGDGKLMLLMADAQVTGGYPRIAQVAAVDLSLCAQLKPGDQIFFKEISRREAERLYIQRENHIIQLKATLAEKYC